MTEAARKQIIAELAKRPHQAPPDPGFFDRFTLENAANIPHNIYATASNAIGAGIRGIQHHLDPGTAPDPRMMRSHLNPRHAQAAFDVAGAAGAGSFGLNAAAKVAGRPAVANNSLGMFAWPRAKVGAASGDKLDMSDAARLQRAREMGFDTHTVYYHGTNATFDKFRPSRGGKLGSGVYLSPQSATAMTYGDNVLPLYVRGKIADEDYFHGVVGNLRKSNPKLNFEELRDAAINDLNKEGFSGYSRLVNGITRLDDGRFGRINEVLVFDPSRIRSTNAAFDLNKVDHNGLLLSSGVPGIYEQRKND